MSALRSRQRVVADLARAGLAVDSDPQDQRQLPGGRSCLVVFDHLTGEVFEELRMTETWGRHRVLAIALPGATLDNSDAWSSAPVRGLRRSQVGRP